MNDAVHNPQRLRVTIDTRSTTHLNARSRTERTGDILHRHTSCTAFQRTRDVGHTVEFGFLGIDEGCGTREESFIHLVHTRHDNVAQCVGIALEDDAHRLQTGLPAIRLHANIRILQHIALTHAAEHVVAVGIGDGGVLRSGNLHSGANQRPAISIEQAARYCVATGCPATLLSTLAVDLNELTLGGSTIGKSLEQLAYSVEGFGIANVCRRLLLAEVSVVVIDFVIT